MKMNESVKNGIIIFAYIAVAGLLSTLSLSMLLLSWICYMMNGAIEISAVFLSYVCRHLSVIFKSASKAVISRTGRLQVEINDALAQYWVQVKL